MLYTHDEGAAAAVSFSYMERMKNARILHDHFTDTAPVHHEYCTIFSQKLHWQQHQNHTENTQIYAEIYAEIKNKPKAQTL